MKTNQSSVKIKVALMASLAAAAACSAHGATVVVPVGNASFETAVSSSGADWHTLPDPGAWVAGKTSDFQVLDIATNTAHFNNNAPDGNHVLNLIEAGSMTQDLSHTINIGDQISLSFWLGNSANQGTTQQGGARAFFMLDGVNSPHFDSTNTAADGQWAFKTVTWTATSGGNLGIRLNPLAAAGGWIDDVSVNVTAVPEPSAALLGGLGALLLLRRRRV